MTYLGSIWRWTAPIFLHAQFDLLLAASDHTLEQVLFDLLFLKQ
jgi:hypothetical protein